MSHTAAATTTMLLLDILLLASNPGTRSINTACSLFISVFFMGS
jgi:hypothetical protein